MAPVKIYTALFCPYCSAAKRLLKSKGVAFEEVDVTFKPSLRAEMRKAAGGRNSVPQIWVGPHHVGGCDELYELDDRDRLDALLARG